MAEFGHPIQCCFIGLIPVSTLLISIWVVTWSEAVGATLVILGCAGQLAFAVYRSGALWRGDCKQTDTAAVTHLPSVAGNFVSAIALSEIGYSDAAKLLFGAGLFSWLALESIIVKRLYTSEPLPPTVRPTLGTQWAPPVVGAVAYLSITHNSVDGVFLGMFSSGFVQVLLLARLTPRFAQTGFSPSYWAFSFGGTAIALASMHGHQVIDVIALPLFLLIHVLIGALFLATLRLLSLGRLFMR